MGVWAKDGGAWQEIGSAPPGFASRLVSTNMVPNPATEGSTPFVARANVVVARSTEQAYRGSGSTLLTINRNTASVFADVAPRIPVVAGEKYSWSFFVRNRTIGARPIQAALIFWTALTGGTNLGTTWGDNPIPTNEWTRRSVEMTAPATATHAAVAVAGGDGVSGETCFVDGLMLVMNPISVPYFDGGFADPAYTNARPAWTGAANNSPSTVAFDALVSFT